MPGTGELLLLAAIALILLGPKQMTEVARVLARVVRDMRRAGNEFQRALVDAADQEHFQQVRKAVTDAVQPAVEQVHQVNHQIQNHIEGGITQAQQAMPDLSHPNSTIIAPAAQTQPAVEGQEMVNDPNQLTFDFSKKEK